MVQGLRVVRRACAVGVVASVLVVPSALASSSPSTVSGVGSGRPGDLAAVAALSPTNVWAVGFSSDEVDGQHARTLILHFDGARWTRVPAPHPGGSDAETRLTGISAVSPTDIWASGWIDAPTFTRGMLLHWDGTSWSRAPITEPDNMILESVSADSASDAWAVGATGTGLTGVALHWDGTSWSVAPVAVPGREFWFNAVDAISPDDAWAVGVSNDYRDTLTEHWDGTSWSIVTSPNGDPKQNSLNAVTATSAGDVWTVGWRGGDGGGGITPYAPASKRQYTLSEHWDGTAWTLIHTPSPIDPIELDGLSATAPDDVWAVGSAGVPTPVNVVEHWDGTHWTTVATPNPPTGSEGSLQDVDADTPSDAWAVGHSLTRAVYGTWVQHWDGTRWTKG